MVDSLRVVAVLIALVLCAASATGYRQSYKETNLGNGSYMVVVEVNGNTSAATARQYAFQRASEVCGTGGFAVIDADGNSYSNPNSTTTAHRTDTTYTSTTVTGGSTGHDFTMLYACNGGGRSTSDGAAGVPRPEDLPRQ